MHSGPRIEGVGFTFFTGAFSIPGNNTVAFDQISVCRRCQRFVEPAVGELRAFTSFTNQVRLGGGIQSDSLSFPEHLEHRSYTYNLR